MYHVVRATELSTFNTCEYKAEHDEFEYKPKILFVGDIVHSGARHDHMQPVIDFYYESISGDYKMKMILQKAVKKARQYALKRMKEAEENGWHVYFEMKLIIIIKEKNVVISGTPDMLIVKEDEVEVVDFKTAKSRKYYEGDDIWNESMQPTVYANSAMQYFKKKKAKFTYFVLEKTSSVPTLEVSSVIDNPQEKVNKLVNKWLLAKVMQQREAKKSRMCWMCGLKKKGLCPIRNPTYSEEYTDMEEGHTELEQLEVLDIGDLDV